MPREHANKKGIEMNRMDTQNSVPSNSALSHNCFQSITGFIIQAKINVFNPTTIHKVQTPMQPVSVSDVSDKPDGSSSVSMRQAQ
jgi:hypothetical protein